MAQRPEAPWINEDEKTRSVNKHNNEFRGHYLAEVRDAYHEICAGNLDRPVVIHGRAARITLLLPQKPNGNWEYRIVYDETPTPRSMVLSNGYLVVHYSKQN